MNTFRASTFNELEDATLLANFLNLPLLLHDISTFAGYKSHLARVDVISEPRFKGKHGVADLRKALSALEALLNSIDVDQQPNAGYSVFVVILRGDIKTFIIDSVETCQLLVTELPGFEIFKINLAFIYWRSIIVDISWFVSIPEDVPSASVDDEPSPDSFLGWYFIFLQ